MNSINQGKQGGEDKVLEALFQHVPTRKRAPEKVEREVREVLHSEWRQLVRRSRKRRKIAFGAIAASLVLALLVSTDLLRQHGPAVRPPILASVEKKTGDVFILQAAERVPALLGSGQLHAGQELSTIQGSRIALNWIGGESVRLDQNSRIALISVSEIKLLSGRIYIDAGAVSTKDTGFVIRTPAGPVSHLGTQYMAAVVGSSVEISVREGKVYVGTDEDRAIAERGQKLRISSDGQRSFTPILTYGEAWQWTEQVTPQFSLDGHTMQDFLNWVGRETGRKIKYASPQSEITAGQILLHGEVDFEPLRALELIMQTSDLVPLLQDGVIVISSRPNS